MAKERLTVVGMRTYSMKGDDGRDYNGITFHCTGAEVPPTEGAGVLTYKFSLSSRILGELEEVPGVGDVISPSYNRYGKVDDISFISRA